MTDEKGGFIALYRSLLEWEWYRNTNVKTLFLHCLLRANWKPKKWQGKEIPRGSFVTSRESLAKEVGLSVQETRTALNKLISTNELTKQATRGYTVITVVNFDKYQIANPLSNLELTNEQPTANQQLTTNNKDNKEIIKEDNDYDNDNSAEALDFESHHFLTEKLLKDKFISKQEELFSYDGLFEDLLKIENFVSVAKAIEYVKGKMKEKTFNNKFGYFKTAMLNQLDYVPEETKEIKTDHQNDEDEISDEELREMLKGV